MPGQAPMPPQGGGAPQPAGAAPQNQQPQGPSAQQLVSTIMQAYQQLSPMIKPGALPPEDVQMFQTAAKSFEAFVQSVSQPHQPTKAATQAAPAQGPIAQHAGKGSIPAPQY